MLRGLPASGKSTWAKEQVEKSKGRVKRVNKDDLRAMLDNGIWSRTNEKAVLAIRDVIIAKYFQLGVDVIVDDTNLHPKHEQQLKQLADKEGYDFEIKDFYCPVSVCEERDAKRPNGVGPDVIRKMWTQFVCKKFDPTREFKDPIIVCDIDGTIAHMQGRDPFQEHLVDTDLFDQEVAFLVQDMAERHQADIYLVSGRHEGCRDKTEQWLAKNGFDYRNLLMRPNGDMRKDYIVKKEIHDEMTAMGCGIVCVFDDRQQVCDMWREQGIRVFQVQDGRF